MKNRLIVVGTLALAICIVVTGALTSSQLISKRGGAAGIGYNKLTVDCPLPNVALSAPCLKVVYEDVTPEEIDAAEGTFGFTGNIGALGATDKDVGYVYIENAGKQLWLFNSGSIGYSNGKGGIDYIPDNLPSYERAREIAENLMQRVEAAGFIPEHYSVRFENVEPAEYSVGADNVQIIHSLSASFDLLFDGSKTLGGDVHIRIGGNGEILAFGGMWRRVEENGSVTIVTTPQSAVDALKSGGFSLTTGQTPQNAVIKNVDLVYYLKSPFEMQDNLPLVYLFKMAGIGADGKEGKIYGEIVPATSEPFNLWR